MRSWRILTSIYAAWSLTHGITHLIDAYVLSFEHGVPKPDPRIFELALQAVGMNLEETLMVGDRASHDGGAAAVGITTLILPPLPEHGLYLDPETGALRIWLTNGDG